MQWFQDKTTEHPRYPLRGSIQLLGAYGHTGFHSTKKSLHFPVMD